MSSIAQEESVSISQNMQWSIIRRMKNGTYVVSSMPYGYKFCGEKFVVDEEKAEVVKMIFREYLNGSGLNRICKILNESGIHKNDDGLVWGETTVRYILTNEKYIGDCLWRKKIMENVFPFKRTVNKGQAEQYYISDDHEPIISREDFEKVQQILLNKGNKFGNHESHVYPFTQKMYCEKCGAAFKRRFVNEIVYWVCKKHDYRAADCNMPRIKEEKIITAFIVLYNKLKNQFDVIFPPLLLQLHELKNKKFGGNQRYMDIAREIAELKEQNHVLARLRTKGFLDEAKYIEQTNELAAKIERLTREQRKIVQSDDEDEVIDQIKEIADIIENGTELMIEFDAVMFESIVEKIIVKNQTLLEFHLYGGLKFTEELR